MPFTFYNNWSLSVTKVVAPPAIQFRALIAGSQASDGAVPGVVGQQVASINGNAWQASLQWSNDNGATWTEEDTTRTPGVTPENGMIVTLFTGVVAPGTTETSFSVQFVYLNPQVNPAGPVPPPPVFTLPAGSFWPKLPGRNESPCCCCCGKRLGTCGSGRTPARSTGTATMRAGSRQSGGSADALATQALSR
jgi:hypothetical protein